MQDTGGITATAAIGEGPAHRLRALITETEARGAPMVSSQALQGRLFEVYDAAAAVPEALALVQRNLGLTLDRTWYSAAEVDTLADQIDWLLGRSALADPETAEQVAEVVAAASEVTPD
ncbi:MAG TPA: hypothetical protein VHW47_07890 [Acidimicrobiales bacterium]|jgi:hypothetical protein|nr:hypothetical protein [Acidimicrobiales bacterium]